MRFKLYYKNQLLNVFSDLEDACAHARFTYFEFNSNPWEGENTPPSFFILIESLETQPKIAAL